MSVEVDCYRLKILGEDVLEKNVSVLPGSLEPVDFLRKVRLLACCDISNNTGSIWISGKNLQRYVSAVLFEDEEDDGGIEVDLCQGEPIRLTDQKQLLHFFSRKRPKKGIYIYLEKDEGDINFEEVPADPEGVIVPSFR